jgi:pyruvate formate lyase activating enzyme
VDSCYADALTILGRYLTVEEVMIEVERDRMFYEKSGGGVTFSGGEPTAQPKFLRALCQTAQQRRLHVTLDTSCYCHWKLLEPIVQHVDLMLCDIKHMDSAVHRQLTGVPNELILDNIQRLSEMGMPIYIRVPLVPGLNDSKANIRATAAFAATLSSMRHFDILPYHRLGEPKWRQLDQAYQLQGLAPPDRPHVFDLADVAREYDIKVQVGG